ncbi:MAG: hypothetical protein OK474_02970 [Thaumarchaeota archaeon]|nr:hypothetical protein [Nitrososphaerota archaeon]
MGKEAPTRVKSEGGASERFCVLCQEEDGKTNETAHDMVTIRSTAGGKSRMVAVCLAHAESLGKPGSPYEIVTAPVRGVRPRSPVRPSGQIQGKSAKGDISRTLRQTERYGKTQRGRLGE